MNYLQVGSVQLWGRGEDTGGGCREFDFRSGRVCRN